MSVLNFPTSPTNGQSYTVGSRTWIWNSTLGVWEGGAAPVTESTVATIIASSTHKASPADADKLGYVTAAGAMVYALWSEIKTWLGGWLDAVATIAGAKSATGQWGFTFRPTGPTTGTHAAGSLLTREDVELLVAGRNLFSACSVAASANASTRRTNPAVLTLDGDISTSAISGNYVLIAINSANAVQFDSFYDSGYALKCNRPWTFYLSCSMTVPTNTEVIFAVGNAVTTTIAIPSSGTSLGFRITSNTEIKAWRIDNGTFLESAAGALTNVSATVYNPKGRQHIWFRNLGNGTAKVYVAYAANGSRAPYFHEATEVATITGVAATPSAKGCWLAMRATGTPGATAPIALYDAKYIEV